MFWRANILSNILFYVILMKASKILTVAIAATPSLVDDTPKSLVRDTPLLTDGLIPDTPMVLVPDTLP